MNKRARGRAQWHVLICWKAEKKEAPFPLNNGELGLFRDEWQQSASG